LIYIVLALIGLGISAYIIMSYISHQKPHRALAKLT